MFSVAVVALCCASAVSAESVVGVPVDGRPSGVPSPGVMSMLPPGKVSRTIPTSTGARLTRWKRCQRVLTTCVEK